MEIFKKHNVNLTRIVSKPEKTIDDEKVVMFQADFEGVQDDPNTQNILKELKTECKNVQVLGPIEVPWFPTSLYDFDHIGKRILGAGDGIQDTDHPGFND